jgi:hypothetical protein
VRSLARSITAPPATRRAQPAADLGAARGCSGPRTGEHHRRRPPPLVRAPTPIRFGVAAPVRFHETANWIKETNPE